MRPEMITWQEVEKLIDHLLPQMNTEFDLILGLTRNGIIPAGLLAEAMHINDVYLASVDIPGEFELKRQREDPRLIAWPKIKSFPSADVLDGKNVLVVGCVWGTGRQIVCARSRVSGAGGNAYTAVLHYRAADNLYKDEKPDFFAAVTDAWIIYPWEASHGKDLVLTDF